ncbi:MAG TPA: FmdB family zinc ribbon protein [Ignavibacteriaceae bacterium]|nr:FmdB family zinc ribbon protein [Ignavibacteriaceae bacterium]
MPTYDYKCLECNHTFEMFQSMTAEPIKNCPKCNGKVKRLIGAGAGPIFKGSGFYQTDYKNNSSSTSNSNKESTPVKDTKPANSNKPGTSTPKKD